jgi:hypothetical protein
VINSWLRNFDVPTVCQDPTVEAIIEELDRRRPQLVTALHEQLTNAFASGGSLYQTFHQEPEARQSFFKAMRSAARFIAMHAVQQANVADLQRRLKASDPDQRLEADQCWQLVKPPLLRCGGECRRLLLVPEGPIGDELGTQIQAGSETQATMIRNAEHDVLLCCEVQNVPLDSVAAHLINGRHHCVAIAQRLRSRVDVQFSAI